MAVRPWVVGEVQRPRPRWINFHSVPSPCDLFASHGVILRCILLILVLNKSSESNSRRSPRLHVASNGLCLCHSRSPLAFAPQIHISHLSIRSRLRLRAIFHGHTLHRLASQTLAVIQSPPRTGTSRNPAWPAGRARIDTMLRALPAFTKGSFSTVSLKSMRSGLLGLSCHGRPARE